MYYKFLDSAHIDKVLIDGTLIVSSLEYFRRLEETEWAGIADPLEGASELTTGSDFVVTENSPELTLINNANIGLGMFKQFAAVSGGGIINMPNVRFVHTVPPLFIYSVAAGDFDQLRGAMCVNTKKPYNACLRIADLPGLRRRIFEAGRIRELNCPVADLFQPGLIGPVEYEARSRDVRQGPVIEPTPFKKEIRFQAQSEVRMLLVPKGEVAADRLTIEAPDLGAFFEEVFR